MRVREAGSRRGMAAVDCLGDAPKALPRALPGTPPRLVAVAGIGPSPRSAMPGPAGAGDGEPPFTGLRGKLMSCIRSGSEVRAKDM